MKCLVTPFKPPLKSWLAWWFTMNFSDKHRGHTEKHLKIRKIIGKKTSKYDSSLNGESDKLISTMKLKHQPSLLIQNWGILRLFGFPEYVKKYVKRKPPKSDVDHLTISKRRLNSSLRFLGASNGESSETWMSVQKKMEKMERDLTPRKKNWKFSRKRGP